MENNNTSRTPLSGSSNTAGLTEHLMKHLMNPQQQNQQQNQHNQHNQQNQQNQQKQGQGVFQGYQTHNIMAQQQQQQQQQQYSHGGSGGGGGEGGGGEGGGSSQGGVSSQAASFAQQPPGTNNNSTTRPSNSMQYQVQQRIPKTHAQGLQGHQGGHGQGQVQGQFQQQQLKTRPQHHHQSNPQSNQSVSNQHHHQSHHHHHHHQTNQKQQQQQHQMNQQMSNQYRAMLPSSQNMSLGRLASVDSNATYHHQQQQHMNQQQHQQQHQQQMNQQALIKMQQQQQQQQMMMMMRAGGRAPIQTPIQMQMQMQLQMQMQGIKGDHQNYNHQPHVQTHHVPPYIHQLERPALRTNANDILVSEHTRVIKTRVLEALGRERGLIHHHLNGHKVEMSVSEMRARMMAWHCYQIWGDHKGEIQRDQKGETLKETQDKRDTVESLEKEIQGLVEVAMRTSHYALCRTLIEKG